LHFTVSNSLRPVIVPRQNRNAIRAALPRHISYAEHAGRSTVHHAAPGRRNLRGLQGAVIAASLLLAFASVDAKQPPPAKKPASQTATPEIAEKQADLGELRNRIEGLRKELNASEENKADAASRLRESERLISRLQREVNDLTEQRGQLQKKLNTLEQQSEELGTTLNMQQAQLEKLLYKQYLRGTPDSLQLLLNGNDPNQMARDLHYLSAIALARAELMGEINATLDRKKALAADAKERAAELKEIEAQQQQRHAELQKQREERKTLYAQISDKVNSQRKEIGNLQQNEKRLTQLIDRLSKILAAQAARAAEMARAAEAARVAEAARQKAKPRPEEKEPSKPANTVETARAKPAETENRYEPVASDGSFARQRGNLRLPVRGAVSGRFGSPRDGGGTWRGLFIKAGNGSEVKAVAGGRVVFAEWMRGFGNLLIIDHGDAYLSIYGNNDALLKQVGQTVKGGETVASVGNSGGNPESGLYFELRHQGQPIDPMKWASLK
jgi:septal ring factor EnvC (AmiA/AmiB activator)